MDVVLTMIDTTGIQKYVFGSNRLRENLGASYLVEMATKAWVFQALDKVGGHNMPKAKDDPHDLKRKPNPELVIESGSLEAELIFAGGGNALLLFASPNAARRFAQILSQRVLHEAPGLEVVIAHREFSWQANGRDVGDQWLELIKRMTERKRARQATPTLQLGLGVTSVCAATGLVAALRTKEWLEPEPRLVGRETHAKLKMRKPAKARLHDKLKDLDPRFEFPDELDQLGHKGGEESYIAVVHLDGNAMGDIRKEFVGLAEKNREYIYRLRRFSDDVEKASDAALLAAFQSIKPEEKRDQYGKQAWVITETKPNFTKPGKLDAGDEIAEGIKDVDLDLGAAPKEITLHPFEKEGDDEPAENAARKAYWPFRPIVFGGDDLTFVCNGQMGLSLAAIFAREFARRTQMLLGTAIHTGGGVCLVKAHYPFRRAYDLSDGLTKEAKRALGKDKRRTSAVDWHISTTGLSGSLGVIREREYQAQAGSLLMRPVRLEGSDWRTLWNFNWLVAVFNFHHEFAGRRNKLKALRDALRAGPMAFEEFLETYELTRTQILAALKLKGGAEDLPKKGWAAAEDKQQRCAYFDALEAMDHHFLLEEVRDERDA